MIYLLTFAEGVLAFLSPCVLPLVPIYVSYFAAGEAESRRTRKNALGFFLGLAVVFISLGAFAGALGAWVGGRPVEILGGVLLVLFGLHYVGVLQLPSLKRIQGRGMSAERLRALSFPWAVVFGAVFALCWTPCVGPLLGAALMKAAMSGGTLEGMFLLLLFALGLGLPFIGAALLIDRLKGAFSFLKRHYVIINRISGGLLILVGLTMILGLFGQFIHGLF